MFQTVVFVFYLSFWKRIYFSRKWYITLWGIPPAHHANPMKEPRIWTPPWSYRLWPTPKRAGKFIQEFVSAGFAICDLCFVGGKHHHQNLKMMVSSTFFWVMIEGDIHHTPCCINEDPREQWAPSTFTNCLLMCRWIRIYFLRWTVRQLMGTNIKEPKWPLFWLEFGPSFGGFFHPKIEDFYRFQISWPPSTSGVSFLEGLQCKSKPEKGIINYTKR